MNCPRCNISLTSDVIDELTSSAEVHNCSSCGGYWFNKGELKKIEEIVEPTFIEIRHIPNKKKQLETLHCPSCGPGQLLEKAEHPRDHKVIVDFCPLCHGIWLDKGELDAIQRENWFVIIGRFFRWLTNQE